MLLSNLMEGDTITTNQLISSIKRLNNEGRQHGTIKALLKNFILPETDNMAIKQTNNSSTDSNKEKYMYIVPTKTPSVSERTKSINEAKMAFLNSTVNENTSSPPSLKPVSAQNTDSTLHYAQIAVTTESDDTRSTGGGETTKKVIPVSKRVIKTPPICYSPVKKRIEPQPRKVSFKLKNSSTSYRRPPLATTKTMTITGSNVLELTKKFNAMVTESRNGEIKQSKLIKTIENIQTASRSGSGASTPTSTLSSSPNIKIVVRQKRGSKRRNNRKRRSSMDSIDKLIKSESSAKISVIRSKSDGNKIPKSPKRRLKYQDSSEQQSGSDSVDGSPVKLKDQEPKETKPANNVVKNVIKKFECEIAQSSPNSNTLKRPQREASNSTIANREKPKVPEKKSTLVLTKNVVVKDGIPKIKTIKPIVNETQAETIPETKNNYSINIARKKESVSDKKKYKTNYIHSDKLPLHVVEIIPEDINEVTVSTPTCEVQKETPVIETEIQKPEESVAVSSEINSEVSPNDSFLWRRKSISQMFLDSDKTESPYCFISITMNENDNSYDAQEISINPYESHKIEIVTESHTDLHGSSVKRESDSDFESSLVEAYNKEVLVGFTSKPKKEQVTEDDYEPLEPQNVNNVVIIPVRSVERNSKINCPLPEIPKESPPGSPQKDGKDNIYQCLLEMRSHPEGGEGGHNYEECGAGAGGRLEERTRGDGHSDDGYEYCKSPIKPYCLASSDGIRIAEDYRPYAPGDQHKNYAITKSVSGASTVSYEKIGSERIYEKIPHRPTRSKEGSPELSTRQSTVSSSEDTGYTDSENIYDTIKQADGASLSHCYESIPNSPSGVKLRGVRRAPAAALKRLSLDAVSTLSQSTVSSEQKTNSLYGQRAVYGHGAVPAPRSEASSDRSDDWVDVSDDENAQHKIIIVQERGRGRKSPPSWSQKVRHQWHKAPSHLQHDNVLISSPTSVYIHTSVKSPYYCKNDEVCDKHKHNDEEEDSKRLIERLEQECWLSVRTILRDGDAEIQDLIAFIGNESSSEGGHVYESLEPAAPAPALPPLLPLHDDFDSFDSDSDTDYDHKEYSVSSGSTPRPPSPGRARNGPAEGAHTLSKIASAAHNKMRQIKRNLTKRYSVAMDGKTFPTSFWSSSGSGSAGVYEAGRRKAPSSPGALSPGALPPGAAVYANWRVAPPSPPVYSNVIYDRPLPPQPTTNGTGVAKEEVLNGVKSSEKRSGRGSPPPRPPPVKLPAAPWPRCASPGKKEAGSLSRKTYLSLKSRFRRAASIALDSDVPSALKITNSTFYLTDSMDGDSGFSNSSDSGATMSGESADNSSGSGGSGPTQPQSRPGSGGLRPGWAESAPCLHTPAPALPRPTLPPPPPPPQAQHDLSAVHEENEADEAMRAMDGDGVSQLKRLLPGLSRRAPRARSSWYAPAPASPPHSADNADTASNNSWYGESSVSGGSSTSGASSGSHPASPLPSSLFTHEPLYQFYNAAKVQSVCGETGDSDSDAYEASMVCGAPSAPIAAPSDAPCGAPGGAPLRPSAMALVSPRGPARTLWCEVPEVVNSAVLSSLSPTQKRLQEAKFEVLTSEASYLNSLRVLETHFMAHPALRDTHTLSPPDWHALFGHIMPVRLCSQQLLSSLERVWQADVLLGGICEAVRAHAEKHFGVYVAYCEQQALMVATLHRLRQQPAFANTLRRLERNPACQALSLHSFLMLPMQRVTRLPLLLDAILKNLSPEDQEYESCMHALATLNNFVMACNEGARTTERVLEMFRLQAAIEFPPHIHNPPNLGPAIGRRDRRPVRWLVRSGEMTQLVWKGEELKLTFGRKFHKLPLHLFLFNDLLVVTKKKGPESYVCVDHCPRSLVEVSAGGDAPHAARHALLLTLLENHQGRTVEMMMSCSGETDLSRWREALCAGAGGAGEAEGEAVYAGWDCPQVAALYPYAAAQPDELALTEGDVVNVTRKTAEGWYYGERTRDGESGWFPGAYTVEIASAHVRARHLRQRYRLLALSRTFRGCPKKPPH